MNKAFQERLQLLEYSHISLIERRNIKQPLGNGIFDRYIYPILTKDHTPLFWRYDLNPETNPFLMERIGINSTFNAGAIKFNNKYILSVRVEGNDRKSFFDKPLI